MVVVVGASGLIGGAVLGDLTRNGIECEGTSSRRETCAKEGYLHVNALDAATWRNLPAKPDAVLLCAARPGLVDCRTHPFETRQLNVGGTSALAVECLRRGAFVGVLSSSFVFDGSRPDFLPGDDLCPACEYGRQKAELEGCIPRDGSAIVRLTKVLDASNPLLRAWRDKLGGGGTIEAAGDARISLLCAGDVAVRLAKMLTNPRPGLWHLSAPDDLSWFDLAGVLARRAGRHAAECVRGKLLREIDGEVEFTPLHGTLSHAWPFESDDIVSSLHAMESLADNLFSATS